MTTRSHTGALIVSTLILVVIILAYMYMHSVVRMSVEQALAARDQVASNEITRAQNKTLDTVYRDTANNRDRVSHAFISSNELVKLIVAVESIGPQSGTTLSLSSIDTVATDSADSSSPRTAVIHAIAHGSWAATTKALQLAETLPYVSSLGQVSLDTVVVGTSTAKRVWNLTFDLRAPVAASATSSATSTHQ